MHVDQMQNQSTDLWVCVHAASDKTNQVKITAEYSLKCLKQSFTIFHKTMSNYVIFSGIAIDQFNKLSYLIT